MSQYRIVRDYTLEWPFKYRVQAWIGPNVGWVPVCLTRTMWGARRKARQKLQREEARSRNYVVEEV